MTEQTATTDTTFDPATYSLWSDDSLTTGQKRALMNLETAVDALRRNLRDIEKYAAQGVESLSKGQTVQNWFRQPVFDFTENQAKVGVLVDLVLALDVPVEKLQAVYTAAGQGKA